MSNLFPVYKRELRSFLLGPVAYMVTVIFLVLSGIFFALIISDYSNLSFDVIRSNYQYRVPELNVAEGILGPFYRIILFLMLLMMPLLTMKSFSEEKKSGTIELIFTYPITDLELVLGKMLAVFTIFAAMLGFTFVYELVILFFKPVPLGVTFSGYLGLLLVGGAFISLGVFISSLTENQVIAGAWTFGMIMVFWMISWLGGDSTSLFAGLLRYLSIFRHFESFASGVIDTRDVVYYFSFIFVFIFSTMRALESRRYRA